MLDTIACGGGDFLKFGVGLKTAHTPGISLQAQADDLKHMAIQAEHLGFESVWVPDRTVFSPDISAKYPNRGYGPIDSIPDSQLVLEPHTVLSFLAGSTSKIKLGFGVLVLPLRNPVVNAKRVTTLDVLSGGRVLFGVGVGWMQEEFEGVNVSFRERGSLTDEHIELFKVACVEDAVEYLGQHFQIRNKVFYPKPLQKPHPPIWIGGVTHSALRRAARVGDGWLPNGLSLPDLKASKQILYRLCEENERSPDSVQIGNCFTVDYDVRTKADILGRTVIGGSAGEIIDDLSKFRDAGLDFALVSFPASSTDAAFSSMSRFAEDIMPAKL